MANIGVIGATGNAGSSIVKEAAARNHKVTAIVRNAVKAKELLGDDIALIEKDAFDLSREDLAPFDVVVNAFASKPDEPYLHVDLATQLVRFFRGATSPRLFFILGASSLKTGEDDHLLVRDLETIPGNEAWIGVPKNKLKELNFLRDVDDVPWVGISPGITFQAGKAKPLLHGKDHVVFNAKGESITSSGTLASAIVDEIEHPRHINERFTVVDGNE